MGDTLSVSAGAQSPPARPSRLGQLSQSLGSIAGPIPLVRVGGRVSEVTASYIRAKGLAQQVQLGSCVEIESGSGAGLGEIIGIQPDSVTIKLYAAGLRVGLGSRVWLRDELVIRPNATWLGRVVDALGQPIDGRGPLAQGPLSRSIDSAPLGPLAMDRVRDPVATGVRAIDLFTPLCTGQRIGIFAGSGVGKSTLIAMLTRSTSFKTIVVALVAERAREVREFLEDVLLPSSARAVTVVATSSDSAMMRKLSAKTAMTVAEHFRDQGDDVLLVVDSVTRFAHAMREVALAAGEAPVARGYPPSVFAELPRLLERAGPGLPSAGSITGVFSVLVDGDDHNEPIADAVRGILDGHIVLNRGIADQGRYPAIDPLTSLSRLASLAWNKDQAQLVRRLRSLISRYEDTKELRTLGAYKPGVDHELDQAVTLAPLIYQLVTQSPDDPPCARIFDELATMLTELRAREATRAQDERKPKPAETAVAARPGPPRQVAAK
ncbi:MAG: FliI/YscN family ATPase [Hyphomicrobiaceae bacterium]